MKNAKTVKLITLMLCVVMMFACVAGSVSAWSGVLLEDTAPGTTPEPSYTDYVKYEKIDTTLITEAVSEFEGEVYSVSGYMVIMRDAKVGVDNMVHENWTVYNVMTGEKVLAIENEYEYTLKPEILQEKEIRISFQHGDNNYDYDNDVQESVGAFVIQVEKITRTKLTEEEKENNYRFTESDLYKSDVETSWYDVTGKLIDTSKVPNEYVEIGIQDIESLEISEFKNTYFVIIGQKIHFLNYIGEHTYSTNKDNRIYIEADDGGYYHPVLWDYENDKYQYYFNASFNNRHFIQVFDKETGSLVLQYMLNEAAFVKIGNFDFEGTNAMVLNNGNILLQTIVPVTEDAADYELSYEFYSEFIKTNLETTLIDIATGEAKEIDCDYLLEESMSRYDVDFQSDIMSLMGMNFGYNTVVTDKFVNMVYAEKIVDKKSDYTNSIVLFCDDNFNIELETAELGPVESLVDILDDGTMVYEDVYNEAYKIVSADGKVLYVNDNVNVYDDYITTSESIYNRELELLYTLEKSTIFRNQEVIGVVGDDIIIEQTDRDYVDGYDNPPEEKKSYYTLHGFKITPPPVEDDEDEAEGEGEGEGATPPAEQPAPYIEYRLVRLNDLSSIPKGEVTEDKGGDKEHTYVVYRESVDVKSLLSMSENYFYVLDTDNKYTLYNAELEHVITTYFSCQVLEMDGVIRMFGVNDDGKFVVYAFS